MTMASTPRRYSKAEFARRGDALVESTVRPNLTAAGEDKFVAIDTSRSGLPGTNPVAAEACGGAAGEASASVPLRLRLRSTEADASPGCGVASGSRSDAGSSFGWG